MSKFIAQDVELSLWMRFCDWLAGRKNRKKLLKEFCHKCNIKYPVSSLNANLLPDEYLISDKEIEYLYSIRDKMILSIYNKYSKCQDELGNEIVELEGKKNTEKDLYLKGVEKLKGINLRLSKETDSLMKITLQGDKNAQAAFNENQKAEVDSLEVEILQKKQTMDDNLDNWKSQVEIIDKVIDNQIKRYITNSTKKIQDQLNFTVFNYAVNDYSDTAKEKIKGGRHEK